MTLGRQQMPPTQAVAGAGGVSARRSGPCVPVLEDDTRASWGDYGAFLLAAAFVARPTLLVTDLPGVAPLSLGRNQV